MLLAGKHEVDGFFGDKKLGFIAGWLCVAVSNQGFCVFLPGPLPLPWARSGLPQLLGRPQHLLRNAVWRVWENLGVLKGNDGCTA